jgi:hypothetical protein
MCYTYNVGNEKNHVTFLSSCASSLLILQKGNHNNSWGGSSSETGVFFFLDIIYPKGQCEEHWLSFGFCGTH